jgi:hypothetical protein
MPIISIEKLGAVSPVIAPVSTMPSAEILHAKLIPKAKLSS